MPPGEPIPQNRRQHLPLIDLRKQSTQSMRGLRNLVETITPWLFEVGSWIFGGLLAFNLLLISSLIAVGPVDAPIRMSITAFACALPMNVAGIFLLRLIKDAKDIRLDEAALQAFQEAGFPDVEAYFPPSANRATQEKRRTNVVLSCALGLAILSATLTFAGLTAALWHMAWWIAASFIAMTIFSITFVIGGIAYSLPPETQREKELRKRILQQQLQQKKEQNKTDQQHPNQLR